MEFTVINVTAESAELRQLIGRLDEDLLERYGPEDIHGIDFADPRTAAMFFAVAYAGDTPVGCGAIRALDEESTELKRFFVEREYRRHGVAARMLAYLENAARERGFRKLKLETGVRQHEAIRFYGKHGYREIPKFGEYVHEKYSLCFEKTLEDEQGH